MGLETDTADSATERDAIRRQWLSRLGDLGLESAVLPAERTLLERSVGEMSEDDLDDLEGRASGALVLLWALGRLATRPNFQSVEEMESIVGECGLLGAGSISKAKETMTTASLRPETELRDALATYTRTRGKAREPTEPEKIVAGVAAHHLEWILDSELEFDVDA